MGELIPNHQINRNKSKHFRKDAINKLIVCVGGGGVGCRCVSMLCAHTQRPEDSVESTRMGLTGVGLTPDLL